MRSPVDDFLEDFKRRFTGCTVLKAQLKRETSGCKQQKAFFVPNEKLM